MTENQACIDDTLLAETSLKWIPFNIVLASLLFLDLYYNGAPPSALGIWYLSIVFINTFLWFYCRSTLINTNNIFNIYYFSSIVFISSIAWGSSYFIFSFYISLMQEFIIILALCSLSISMANSLSLYLPAFYAYIVPLFVPIIIYNLYSLHKDRIALACIYFLFLFILIITTKINSRLLLNNLKIKSENTSIEEISLMSLIDPLTGLYNRRHFNTMLKSELDRSKRCGQTIHLIVIDVSNFKYINETFGHSTGDDFLINIAASLKVTLRRASDTIYRLNGDEFAATVVNMDDHQVKLICQEILDQFNKECNFENVSLSIGIIAIKPNCRYNIKEIVDQADKTILQAKTEGNNKIFSVTL